MWIFAAPLTQLISAGGRYKQGPLKLFTEQFEPLLGVG